MRIAFLVLLIAAVSACEKREPLPEQQYQPRSNFLSGGDPASGRKAFFALKCDTCHTVAGEKIVIRDLDLTGPQLGSAQALQSPDQIASSIAAPTHMVSKIAGPPRKTGGSSMGDYSHVITVSQLVDLVAYIRSLPDGR